MNETAIVKFLAEQMGWELHKGVNPGGGIENYWMLPQEGVFQHSPPGIGEAREKDFDPMNDITHAFMVREAFGAKVVAVFKESQWDAGKLHDAFEASFRDTDFLNVEPRDYCIAIARALATDEQLVELGL